MLAVHEVNEKGQLVLTAHRPNKWALLGVVSQHEHAGQLLAALVAFEAEHPAGPKLPNELLAYRALIEAVQACLTSTYVAVRARALELEDLEP